MIRSEFLVLLLLSPLCSGCRSAPAERSSPAAGSAEPPVAETGAPLENGLIPVTVKGTRGVIVPPSSHPEGIDECSVWTPDVASIVRFETGITGYLEEHARFSPPEGGYSALARRYVGGLADGIRILSVRFVCASATGWDKLSELPEWHPGPCSFYVRMSMTTGEYSGPELVPRAR